jgi:hypothetical protein
VVDEGRLKALSAIEARVLLCLMSRAKSIDRLKFWPGVRSVARDIGCRDNPKRVREALRALEHDHKLIVTVTPGKPGRGTPTKRRLKITENATERVKSQDQRGLIRRKDRGSIGGERGSNGRKIGGQNETQNIRKRTCEQ